MATPSKAERSGFLFSMYKKGGTAPTPLNTAPLMAAWIVQNIYDNDTQRQHRTELLDAITTALALFGGTI